MNELALFVGIGGGLLGSRLLGWRTVCAVGKEPYRREVLLRRQRDGVLDLFPIWDRVETFDGRPWRWLVDVVTAGFPCQPFSSAGKRLGANDSRNLWPQTARVLEEVRPALVLLENVPGIIRYLPVVRGDLRRMGYCVPPFARVSAAAVGAGHRRRRLWICAYAHQPGCQVAAGLATDAGACRNGFIDLGHGSTLPPDAHAGGQSQLAQCDGPAEAGQPSARRRDPVRCGPCDWWAAEPDVVRVAHGIPFGMDRIAALGDAQVPAVVRAAWIDGVADFGRRTSGRS